MIFKARGIHDDTVFERYEFSRQNNIHSIHSNVSCCVVTRDFLSDFQTL